MFDYRSSSGFVVAMFACYGMTFLLCGSTLLRRPRAWLRNRHQLLDELLGCYFCTGFWVALLAHAVLVPFRFVLLYAFAGAASSFLLNSLHVVLDGASDWLLLQRMRALETSEDGDD